MKLVPSWFPVCLDLVCTGSRSLGLDFGLISEPWCLGLISDHESDILVGLGVGISRLVWFQGFPFKGDKVTSLVCTTSTGNHPKNTKHCDDDCLEGIRLCWCNSTSFEVETMEFCCCIAPAVFVPPAFRSFDLDWGHASAVCSCRDIQTNRVAVIF